MSCKDEEQLTSTLQHSTLPGQYKRFASGLQLESALEWLQKSQFNTETCSHPWAQCSFPSGPVSFAFVFKGCFQPPCAFFQPTSNYFRMSQEGN